MQITLVDVPTMRAIAIDGTAKPGSPEFQEAIAALYPVAYTLRFMLKAEGIDEKVRPLEGLYDREMHWTLLIGVPDAVDEEHFEAAVAKAAAKKGVSPALNRVRLDTFDEGKVVEAVHIGPYATEPTTVAAMDAYMAEQGLHQCGPHHEIYLSDPNRTAPERLKTILRHPVS